MTKKDARKPPGRPASKARSSRDQARASVRERQASSRIKIDDLDHGLADIPVHLFAKGRVIKRYLQCGKRDCSCHKGGKRHGPYHYLVVTIPAKMRSTGEPKQRWFYLTKDEAERFRARIRNYDQLANNMFSDLIEELNTGRSGRRRR